MKIGSPRLDAADGMMLGVAVMWAVNNILVKNTVRELPALPFVVGRSAIVLVLIWVWIAWRRMPAGIALSDVPLFILAGITGFGVFNTLYTMAMEWTSAFSASLFMAICPVFTLLYARALGIERPTVGQWLAVLMTAAGVTLFMAENLRAEGFGGATIGNLLGLVAAILFAAYSLVARPLTERYGALQTTAWAILFGFVVIAPWGVPASIGQPWGSLSLTGWGTLVYASAIAMLGGYTLWGRAIARAGVARTVPYLFLIPVMTGTISAVALGEEFGPLKIVGAAIVLAGTALVRTLGRGIVSPRQSRRAEDRFPAEAPVRAEVATADARSGD